MYYSQNSCKLLFSWLIFSVVFSFRFPLDNKIFSIHSCGLSSYSKGRFNIRLYVCNYGETGNILRRPVYKVGRACSNCPCQTPACSQVTIKYPCHPFLEFKMSLRITIMAKFIDLNIKIRRNAKLEVRQHQGANQAHFLVRSLTIMSLLVNVRTKHTPCF